MYILKTLCWWRKRKWKIKICLNSLLSNLIEGKKLEMTYIVLKKRKEVHWSKLFPNEFSWMKYNNLIRILIKKEIWTEANDEVELKKRTIINNWDYFKTFFLAKLEHGENIESKGENKHQEIFEFIRILEERKIQNRRMARREKFNDWKCFPENPIFSKSEFLNEYIQFLKTK